MFLVTIFALAAVALSAEARVLKVSLYFESLCPYSKAFINTQLYPAYQLIPEYLDLEFVPFGNAKITNDTGVVSFICQHGFLECYGNDVQGCALSLDKVKATDFINCAMASDDASDNTNLQACAESSGYSWEDVLDCVITGQAAQLFILNGLRTAALVPPLTFVPTIFLDGVYNDTLQDMAQFDFLNTACTLLDQEPAVCATLNN